MKKVIMLLAAVGLSAVACNGPVGPSTDSGTFELSLLNANERLKSTGEGYNFETGEKITITNRMADDPDMGTYSDLDAFPYSIWAKNRLQKETRTRINVGEGETVSGLYLCSLSGREYKITVRNEVTARTAVGVESKYIVTYRAIDSY